MSLFEGAGVALITPFTEDNQINYEKLEELIEFQIANKTDAIIAAGTTAESATLTPEERMQVIKFCIERTKKRTIVIAGTGTNNTASAVEFSKKSYEYGADMVMAVTPYYNKGNESGLIDYYTQIANSVKCPVIMYSVPSRTGVKLSLNVIKTLSEISNIQGIKEASGDISYVADIVNVAPKLDLYSGNDDMVTPMMALGAKGVISVTSNIIPKENHDMVMNFLNGNVNEAIKTQIKYIDFVRAMFIETNPAPIKEAMNIMGFNVGECRSPLGPLSEKNREHVKNIINKYGLKK
ncbi:4-hydroxy-tetrahydrodipicolinate synthase [Brachyspira hyodysenteriae]|uniref:4-hydroxy-tetrahydrodipicolinate synthase n=2 Tax=Brachyspira hyodysenteriae TaxID=159 RepID=DAPA_BRAHW|nr:4-hydroxy-tetrahydrodipicolinate synthase [Brachyspira hyodysenteriae]C0R176.1 RecName: Full=4-hydroxy-tetrahydrodipicolinate synthase; Short=HTPA synthase [Brachyspira hyodysenteriae WA1]ACN83864.1 dihydrodipicolinate synthase [Brachyspira hyodysenteriae WA1]ANN64022.1 4-hydroxy-tetrahydrodipicolinate synthase [Brachyspira hyodysenteriae ATCC 27164]AUJ49591.1 4-hydroxy-tetrahydrodipicolinate synthase [Brachyspira hyodysenteriae]KLI14461.1 dihydrodipicolinate synthase [Brachyspira hyodysent